MPNDYFRFMRFTVSQDRTAMKVGTDGVLLGAWCGIDGVSRALDVGTGTGLIALMIAQRSGAHIDAVEIDDDAFSQARNNFSASPWGDRIGAFNAPFQEFARTAAERYDLIVSNPPYFTNSLLPESESRARARHADTLPLEEFFPHAAALLSPAGRIALILPHNSEEHALRAARASLLYPSRTRNVRTREDRDFFRILIEFSATERATADELVELDEPPLTIEGDSAGQYSDEYRSLTDDFYLFGRNGAG
jgi:tRNA1Val (adenine37-N6)-methyltransferase